MSTRAMPRRARRLAAAAAVAAGLFTLCDAAAAARQCSERKTTASGAPSNLAFLARSRARAAWVGKVSRDARLGPTYAQWLKSQERRLVCRKVDTMSICVAVALPCRTIPTKITL